MGRIFRQLPFYICSSLFVALCFAGDVSYTLWEDEDDQVWIRIQNGSERNIRVEAIILAFYNSKGKPIDQKQYPCSSNCLLMQHDVRDFGPYSKPENSETCRLQKVLYAIQ